jgi:SAM-dependent methyltransferase
MSWLRRVGSATGLMLLALAPAQALDEVPFVTTPDNVTLELLKLAGVGPRDHVIDLGSGDGRIVITAAKHFGASGTGVEIVPDLVLRSRDNARRAGVSKRAQFIEQDLFKADLAKASVVTLYLLPEVNLQLRPKLLALKPGTRIVSHDWDMGDWPPERTLTVDAPDKAVGREKKSTLHPWVVPAPVQGLWCGTGSRKRVALRLTQKYQSASASLHDFDTTIRFDVRISGAQLSVVDPAGNAALRWQTHRLTFTDANGAFAGWRGVSFEPTTSDRCG